MKLERTTTGLIIHEAPIDVKRKVLQYFSLKDPVREYFIYSGKDPNKKPLFGRVHDAIYISSGFLDIKDPVIQKLPRPSVISYATPTKVSVEMNRQPRSKLQEDCIHQMITSKSNKITIELKPGVGKEQPYSTKIPTPTEQGYTLMGDLKVGDYVFDRTGNKTKILQIFEQGEKDVFKITFQDGRVAYCGAEHLWTVKSHKNGVWKTVQTIDMIKDFKRISPWKMNNGREDPYVYKYYIPMCQAVNYPKREVPIDPWVLGCFIGNGCCREENLTISSGTDEIPTLISHKCNFTFKKNPANYSYTFYTNDGEPIKTKEFFKDIPEIVNEYSRDKSIPSLYMINDVETRINLVKGLMDTDGSISYSGGRYNMTYTSCSLKLLEQLRSIIYSLGYTTGKIVQDMRIEKYTEGFCGSIHLKIPNEHKRLFFDTQRKFSDAVVAGVISKENIFDDLLIKDISFSHREQCRCIMVDNPEHLYLTEDFIVTHNTFIALYAISKLGLKPLIVAPTTLLKNQWIENLEELGINRNDIATKIWDAPNKTFCVVTISSIGNAIRDDWEGLMNTMAKSNFGIKVVDEAHLSLKANLRFDAICNIKHNWYLSATLGRSSPEEDEILNFALADAERFVGDARYEEYQHEYINIYYQDVYYYPSQKLCQQTLKYGKKGLIKASYYQMLMEYKNGVPLIKNIIDITKRARRLVDYGKMVMVIPLLSIIDKVLEAMEADPFFSKYSFGSVDGSMPLSQRREILDGDIILSTIQSIGTGVDIPDLSILINFDAFKSPITSEQCVGRCRRRKDDKDCYYVDVCDNVKYARTISNWVRSRQFLLPYFPGVKSEKINKFPDIHS